MQPTRKLAVLASLFVGLAIITIVGLAPSVRSARQSDAASAGEPFVFNAVGNGQRIRRYSLKAHDSDLVLVDDANGQVLIAQPLATTSEVRILGVNGDTEDTLTIDFSGGVIAPPNGIRFDGGSGGFDTLKLRGGSFQKQHAIALSAHDGIISLDAVNIAYSNIEPIDDVVPAASYTISATAAGEVINIIDGPIVGADQTTQVNSPSFELINFANKTSVTVNGLAGDDTFTLNNPTPGVGLTSLTIDTGSSAGLDVVNVLATPSTVVTNLTSSSGVDDLFIGNAGDTQGILGAINVSNSASFSEIIISDSADATARTIGVSNSAVTGIAPATISFNQTELATLHITAGTGADTFNVTNTFVSSFATPLTVLFGSAGNDTFNVQTVATGSTFEVNAGAGNDSINLGNAGSLDNIGAGATIFLNGDANDAAPTNTLTVTCGVTVTNTLPVGDTITFDDASDLTVNTYTLTDTTFQRGAGPLITYSTAESLGIVSGTAGDTVNVTTTPASTNVTIQTTAGGDAVNVTTTGATSNMQITGDASANAITLTTTGVSSATQVLAGGGGDTLTQTANGASSGVSLSGEDGADSINIRAATALSATVANGGTNNDEITVGSAANSLDGILGPVCVNGDANDASPTSDMSAVCGGALLTSIPQGDTLRLFDFGDADPQVYGLSAIAFSRAGGFVTLSYSTIETTDFRAGTGTDTIDVDGTPASSRTTIDTSGGGDAVNVNATGVSSQLVITGDAVANTVIVTSTGATSNLYVDTLGGSDIISQTTNGAGSSCEYRGGTGADTMTLRASTAGSSVSLNGDAGNDTFNVGSGGDSLDGILGTTCVDGGANDAAPTSTLTATGSVVISNTLAVGDTLIFNDQGDADSSTYTVDATTFQRTGLLSSSFSTIESLTINAGSGNDTINVTSTPGSATTTINTVDGGDSTVITTSGASSNLIVNGDALVNGFTVATTGASSVVQLNGLGGIDTFSQANSGTSSGVQFNGGDGAEAPSVTGSGTGSVTEINGGNDDDTTTIGSGNLSTVLGNVAVDGEGGTGDSVIVNDSAVALTSIYTITSTTLTRSSFGGLLYGTIEALTLNAQTDSNLVTISSTAASTPVTVNAGDGSDTVNVGAGDLSLLPGAVTVNGDGSVDSIIVNDLLSVTNNTYTITPTVVTRAGFGGLGYATTESLRVNGGSGSDTFNLTPSASTAMTTAGSNPFPPTSPGDTLNVDITGATSPFQTDAVNFFGHFGSFTFGNRQPVNYLEMETVTPCLGGPPIASGVPINPTSGASFSGIVALFTDPNNSSVGTFTVTINWGDSVTTAGTVNPDGYGGYTVSGTHTYATPGSFTTTVTITNTCSGLSVAANGSVTVDNAALQINRTWVSQLSGDDANACTRTAPCKTFQAALAKTRAGGEIDVLDPGSFGTVNINKAVTIDGGQHFAGIRSAIGVHGITVNGASNDVVVLRNLTINGSVVNSDPAPLVHGINFISGGGLIAENVAITQFSNAGIGFTPAAGAKLFIRDAKIYNNTRFGLFATSTASGTAAIDITRSLFEGNGPYGSGIGMQFSTRADAVIRDTSTSGNGYAGMYVESGGLATSRVVFEGSVSVQNTIGIASGFSPGSSIVYIADTTITNNTGAGISYTVGTGQIISIGNNRIAGNAAGNGPPSSTLPRK